MKRVMKSVLLALSLSLAGASGAWGAVVTYTLEYDFGTCASPNTKNWAVYAQASTDSAGLFAYGVDLLPFTGATQSNRGNGVIMENSSTGEQRNLGFTAGRTNDAAARKFSGLADLGAGADMIPIYGIGQQDDDLDNYIPPGFDTQTSTFGGGRNPYSAKFLLASGTWTGSIAPAFDTASVDSKASVYVNRSGIANQVATLQYQTRLFEFPFCGSFVSLSNTAAPGTTNQAVGGAIAVSGANNKYVSEIDELVSNALTGNAPIQTIGDEAGNVYVMAKLAGNAADISAVLGTILADVGPEDSQFASLHGAYDSQFGGVGFNALFRFPNLAGAKIFNWDFTGNNVSIDQLAAVPEPGMLSLMVISAAIFGRRRRAR